MSKPNPTERVIALGFFDGVHLGHAALLKRTVEAAKQRGCVPAVFTFDRPPKEVATTIISGIRIRVRRSFCSGNARNWAWAAILSPRWKSLG